ncbi:hypothetical protein DDE05_08150 [Streptomyces cavourensis]|nr:hypothetical protein DDE05_08150 [Streptomyces cavourensis]
MGSGSTGANVTTIQHLLTARNHATAADGIFGSGTADKVKGFQRSQSLTADGVVGPDTWRALVSGSGSGGGGGGGSTKLTHAQVSSMFSGAGITWTSTGNCSNRNVSTCTSFEQMRRTTAEGTVALRRASGCAILVTGGTETGHANGTYSHWNGYKVDFSPQSCISNYITRTFTRIGDRGDGAAQYKSASGNVYAREGSHWDVTFHN